MSIAGSVGQGGQNRTDDVKRVQALLNKNRVKPELQTDGYIGKKTINAIRWFQERIVRLRTPDGRVDPGGKTWCSLNSNEGSNSKKAAPQPSSPSIAERKEYRTERRKFVDPRVKENAITTNIIDAAYPHFRGTSVKVISGYLSDSDLFWKVNYHWEYLLWMIEHSLTLSISDSARNKLQTIKGALKGVTPNPASGYRNSGQVGKPVDKSPISEANKRYRVLKQQKKEFKSVTESADLMNLSRRSNSTFHLAAAPVAHPGTSKHSSGYALDLKGSAGTIRSISNRIGATLVFDEKSHVHVEMKNGVKA